MADQVFNWCFIGSGRLGDQVAGEIIRSGRHRVVSCYSRNPETGAAFAKAHDCVFYDSAEAAITAGGVDAVYVVTPHNAHHRYAKLALELGKPVLCEKPFTVEAKDTEELIALAREKELYLCEAMWTWFGSSSKGVMDFIRSGKLGTPKKVLLNYHMNSLNYAPRVSDPRRAGGALLDITIYPITYAYRLFGKPKSIRVSANLKDGIDLGEEIDFEYDGFTAHISASLIDMKGLEKLDIQGTKGRLRSSFYHINGRIWAREQGQLFYRPFGGEKGFVNTYIKEFDTVASEIRAGLKESPLVPLQATCDVMHLLDDCRALMGLEYDCE